MDWCPVEWPPRPQQSSVVVSRREQSGKKAARAGFTGLMVLALMVGLVLGYGVWSKRIASSAYNRLSTEITRIVSKEIPVKLVDGGREINIRVRGKTVHEVLKERGIQIANNDLISPSLDTRITGNMQIHITRVEIKDEIKEETLPFNTKQIPNPDLPVGVTSCIQEGQEGLERQTWQVEYRDGAETSRKCVGAERLQEPIENVIQYGTMSSISRGGEVLRFTRALDMLATGYSYTGFKTATGVNPGPGVAAVDPRVIPLGTRLYIEGYGKAVAEDTGGLIKGNRVDLFYETDEQAVNWGARRTKVYILDNSLN